MPVKRPCCGTIEDTLFRIVPDDAGVLRHLNDQLIPRNGCDHFKAADRICKSHFKDPYSCARFKSTKTKTLFQRWFQSDDGLDVDLLRLSHTDSADRIARRFARGADHSDDEQDGNK